MVEIRFQECEVLLTLSPTDDDGRFNLRFDGVTVKSNAGHGATTGARPISAGAHTVSQKGAFGTDLSEYQSFFDGGCAANGTVTVGSCLSQSCTLTNVRATGQNCQQQCRDERDRCFKDPEMTPAICVKLFKDCLASCNK
jgi:hypothetical protein